MLDQAGGMQKKGPITYIYYPDGHFSERCQYANQRWPMDLQKHGKTDKTKAGTCPMHEVQAIGPLCRQMPGK
jgi:hypothetical protein